MLVESFRLNISYNAIYEIDLFKLHESTIIIYMIYRFWIFSADVYGYFIKGSSCIQEC
jgi:hypothetical protein